MALGDGTKSVTTAGTRVRIEDGATAVVTQVWMVTIQAKTTNTGVIWVGGPQVAAGRGISLAAGQSVKLGPEEGVSSLADVWLDCAVNGEGVTYLFGTPT